MTPHLTNLPSALALGKTLTLFNVSPSAAGSESVKFAIESESVMMSLYVEMVSGTLDVVAYTMDGDNSAKDVDVITFPTIAAPTTELVLKKAALVAGYIWVEATYTGACSFTLKARGMSSGESSAKITGSSDFRATQTTIPSGASQILIAASLDDRDGLVLKNYDANGRVLFIGESDTAANVATGYPITAGESIGIDLAAGAEVWGIASTGTIDVRIMESGG